MILGKKKNPQTGKMVYDAVGFVEKYGDADVAIGAFKAECAKINNNITDEMKTSIESQFKTLNEFCKEYKNQIQLEKEKQAAEAAAKRAKEEQAFKLEIEGKVADVKKEKEQTDKEIDNKLALALKERDTTIKSLEEEIAKRKAAAEKKYTDAQANAEKEKAIAAKKEADDIKRIEADIAKHDAEKKKLEADINKKKNNAKYLEGIFNGDFVKSVTDATKNVGETTRAVDRAREQIRKTIVRNNGNRNLMNNTPKGTAIA